ncbi:MAG: hypothetical protein ABSA11_16045 [Candidatus Bathyarchaeia archaeon]|jgi:hypothetical protein
MKESSEIVIKMEIKHAVEASKRFRNCAKAYGESDNFHHIYNDIASIYESYGISFIFVLFSEGVLQAENFEDLLGRDCLDLVRNSWLMK